ncbi:IS110 family transposase [Chryseobacterium piperi]|uniref:IS110 family transposase n=1 Tax=Chryseobacterium piperi TaxID=558152 RepID=UPI000BAAED30|nr:IS110 family transposase [Chryseobacterium piperi]ASW73498.1 IS110 family transposase [Chryseobacterium piperi]
MKNVIIGIDVSKLTLDISVLIDSTFQFFTIENTVKALKKFFKEFKEHQVMIAMENTGRYNYHLYEVLPLFEFKVYVINPLHIKRSIGLVRDKNDKIDSKRIALFLEKHHIDLRIWSPCSKTLQKIKLLNTERRLRVKIRAALLTQLADQSLLKGMQDKDLLKLNKDFIALLDKQISFIEDKILYLIENDEVLKDQYHRIQTIPGVGKVLAANMLIKTNGFTEIQSAREMSCYAGVAPFEYQSGTSLKYKSKVSPLADKELKKILHLAAMSAIRFKNDLAVYYLRKVSEGKNKMSVLNAVRNKIIHRIYSLIKNKTFYQNQLEMS